MQPAPQPERASQKIWSQNEISAVSKVKARKETDNEEKNPKTQKTKQNPEIWPRKKSSI